MVVGGGAGVQVVGDVRHRAIKELLGLTPQRFLKTNVRKKPRQNQ